MSIFATTLNRIAIGYIFVKHKALPESAAITIKLIEMLRESARKGGEKVSFIV